MTDTLVLACRTIESELRAAMASASLDYPIVWIESGLHNTPKKLTAALQESLRKVHCDRVLMAMGFCGNTVAHLKTGNFEMVLPRADDCISLLMGYRERQCAVREAPTYFLTKGWMDGERNIWTEYRYAIEKFGQAQGQRVFDMMFGSYTRLGVLDTGAYPIAEIMPDADKIAGALGLACQIIRADCHLLRQLLTGPWPEESFICIPQHSELALKDLQLRGI